MLIEFRTYDGNVCYINPYRVAGVEVEHYDGEDVVQVVVGENRIALRGAIEDILARFETQIKIVRFSQPFKSPGKTAKSLDGDTKSCSTEKGA